MRVRPVQLADCEQIAALSQAQINIWQRWDDQGRVEDVAYSALSIYERWLHGGPWMSLETAAIHLGRLLLGAGYAWVAEEEGFILGYAEAYHGNEAEPFGTYLHLGSLVLRPQAPPETANTLLDALRGLARNLKCTRLLTAATAGEAALHLFQAADAALAARLARYSVPARTGQGLYQAVTDTTADPRAIAGWSMPLGRASSARQAWEMSWLPTWDVLPELGARSRRLKFSASGQDAYLVFQRGLFDPRVVEVLCWTPRLLSGALWVSIRDFAYREGFRSLNVLVPEDQHKVLGSEAEADGYIQTVLRLGV